MIPLRCTDDLKRFPTTTLAILVVFVAAHVVSYLWPGLRTDFLHRAALESDSKPYQFFSSLFFHHHLFSLLVTLIYLWVFCPRVIERRGLWLTLVLTLGCATISLYTFLNIHPHNQAPILGPEAFVGAILGLFMRKDIWGTVTTLVIGPGWLRIYEVPSYVLLFFWFFYLLLGNFFLEAPFSEAPMLYWIPFSAFLVGFLAESAASYWVSKSTQQP